MFEFVRTHQRLMQFLLLLLIIPSFALVGLQSYSSFGDSDSDSDSTVAKVAGQPITHQDWDAALRDQMSRMQQAFGERFDPKMLETPEAKQGVLDNLIWQRVLAATATRKRLTVSDPVLQQTILGMFPNLVGADGKFDSKLFNQLLAAQGMTQVSYAARLRQDLAMQQLSGAVQATAFTPKTVATRLSDIGDQEREVQELLFKARDYAAQVKVTDAMLQDYYAKNAKEFEIPERIKAEYVVLDSAAAAAQVTVSDADIKSYYDSNVARYTTPEERRASHILISVKRDAPAAELAAAKAKAESLLAQARKNPADFAKLAKANSQDTASAEMGGDLGYFANGMMVKPFEDAAAKLKQGEISDLVQSDFGYHIIELTGIKPAQVKPLDQVKADIGGEIKKQLAAKKFAELAETFSNTVYEQADSLKSVADKMHLQIQTADNLGRQVNPAVAPTAPFNNQKFLTALYSTESLQNKHNTEAVEIAPNTFIAGHVVDYKPVTKRAFEEVEAIIRDKVTRTEEIALAKKAGQEKLAALKAQDSTTGFGASQTVSRVKSQGVNPLEFDAVMKADVSKLPAFVGVELPQQGYALYRIGKVVQPANVDQARRTSEQQQITAVVAQQEMLAYVDVLKEKAKVKILKSVASSSVGSDSQ
ncbi:SurA N-terminal domain-containing protein [Collimonas sp.]|jgi:peptidyl-prolyl cis-trans isomerase D|uniref:SurA N-terminal domain-containing protein n=1 Tax=Collimonas sp. TaxID=1963772 RepID=UPI0037BE32DD